MRVLVTGSRDWDDREAIRDEVERIWREHGPFTLVHGDCPTGADAIADDLFTRHHIDQRSIERFPADWAAHGKRAGYLRNKAMIDSRPDLVLAFIRNESRGASMTVKLAEAAGIPVITCKEIL